MRVKEKVFLVTGAGSGLGAAVARMAVDRGGRVLLIDLNEGAGKSIDAELGDAARFVRADVSSAADGAAAISAALDTFGRIDGLVNCAGVGPAERILGRHGVHDLDRFARVISINLIGTFNMLRLVAEAAVRNDPGESGERGVIINTASVAAYDGQIGQAAYSASKGGVAALTLPAARDLAGSGIRVVAIAPGIFGTPMVTAMPQDVQDSLARSVPFPARLGRPEEFAHLVGHIIENQMLNGEVIRIDGAIRMASR